MFYVVNVLRNNFLNFAFYNTINENLLNIYHYYLKKIEFYHFTFNILSLLKKKIIYKNDYINFYIREYRFL